MARGYDRTFAEQITRHFNKNKDETKKWDKFAKDVGQGKSFGDGEVQRALDSGYTTNDVNDYLKYSGITPKGSFAVGGYNKSQVVGGSGDGANFSTKETPFFKYFGNATATPKAPPAAPAADPQPESIRVGAAMGNPQLTIPGVDVRLSGENLGIKPAKSAARKMGSTNRGTSRLTIPRSSGFNPLNI